MHHDIHGELGTDLHRCFFWLVGWVCECITTCGACICTRLCAKKKQSVKPPHHRSNRIHSIITLPFPDAGRVSPGRLGREMDIMNHAPNAAGVHRPYSEDSWCKQNEQDKVRMPPFITISPVVSMKALEPLEPLDLGPSLLPSPRGESRFSQISRASTTIDIGQVSVSPDNNGNSCGPMDSRQNHHLAPIPLHANIFSPLAPIRHL